MSYDNDNARAVVFDLETLPIEGVADYLEPIEAPSNYVNPAKKRDYIVKAMNKAAVKASTDPDLCRIAVLGMLREGEAEPAVYAASDEDSERELLTLFWQAVSLDGGGHRRTVSFYGLSFDWPVIIQRSRYLDVPHLMSNLDKYRSPHADLYWLLNFRGITPGHSLNFYSQRFGLDVPKDAIDGSQIADVIAAGEWAAAMAHCRIDVLKTTLLAQRLGVLSRWPLTVERQAVA